MEQIIVSVLCIAFGLIAFYAIVYVGRMKRSLDNYMVHCRKQQKQREQDKRRQALRNRAGLYDRGF